MLARLYKNLPQPDFISIAQCYVFLNRPKEVAALLNDFLTKASGENDEQLLVAYQIAFDITESATQKFLNVVLSSLPAASEENVNPFSFLASLQWLTVWFSSLRQRN